MKTISQIFEKSDSPLTKLVNKTKNSGNLEAIFHTALDMGLAKHCHFANYQDSLLTVTVSNTSWATRLRYAIPDIIKNLKVQPEFRTITKIRYTVATTNKKTPKKKRVPAKISKENERLWKKTLKDIKKKGSKKNRTN